MMDWGEEGGQIGTKYTFINKSYVKSELMWEKCGGERTLKNNVKTQWS